MAIKQQRIKRFGPPGTGKTYTTLQDIERDLEEGVPPQNVGYLTFTKNAATEGRERMQQKFGFGDDDMPYARTLHSLCYRETRVRRDQVADYDKLAKWGESKGWEFTGQQEQEDPNSTGKLGDWLLGLWDLARNRLEPDDLAKVIRGRPIHPDCPGDPLRELTLFVREYEQWKSAGELVDFADMLLRAVQMRISIPVVSLYVDESQDLSPLQWQVVELVSRSAQKVTVAGDDDQAIFTFQGGEPDLLLNWPATQMEVLNESRRISGAVHRLAQAIIRQNQRRQMKEYIPRQEEGGLYWADGLYNLPLDEGSWFILGRNRAYVSLAATWFFDRGYPFRNRRGFDPLGDGKVIRAAKALYDLSQGQDITLRELYDIYEGVPSKIIRGELIRHGAKAALDRVLAQTGEEYRAITLRDSGMHQLTTLAIRMITEDPFSLLKASPRYRSYLASVVEGHGIKALSEEPRITVSTIHGVKGEERDHVAIDSSMSSRTHEGYLSNPEEERRVFYVGVTRARKTLWQLEPTETGRFFDWPLLITPQQHAAD